MKRLLFLLFSFLIITTFCSCGENAKYFETKPVDNYINNYIAGGNLVRVEDALYYNYYSDNRSGIIKISKNFNKSIYNSGFNFKGGIFVSDPLYTNGETLYRYYEDITSFEKLSKNSWKGVEWKEINEYFYVLENDHTGEFNLYSSKNNEIIYESIIQFYPYMSGCVFATYNYDRDCTEFYYFDSNNESLTLVGEMKHFWVHRFFIEDEYLICSGTSTVTDVVDMNVYYLSLADFDDIESIYTDNSFDGSPILNVYNSVVYICTDEGIYSFDLKTKESKLICNEIAEECYILDDEFLYFVDYKDKLSRVNLKTNVVEVAYY